MTIVRRSWVVVGAAALAACGGTGGKEAATPRPVLPATTTIVTVPSDAPPLVSTAAPGDVGAPCPDSQGGASMDEAARLEPMLGQVLAYGGEHPDEFASYGMIWHGDGDASVFAAFSGSLDQHAAVLEALVPYPDELIVCGAALNETQARAIEATLVSELSGRFLSLGRTIDGVAVVLAPDAEDVAADLVERYGNAVDVRVGLLDYPMADADNVCPAAAPAETTSALGAAVVQPELARAPDRIGYVSGALLITNTSDELVQVRDGPVIGVLVDQDGAIVAPGGQLQVGAVGSTFRDLQPGESMEVPFSADTASCDPALGYQLPAGDYGLVIRIPHGGSERALGPLPITIAD